MSAHERKRATDSEHHEKLKVVTAQSWCLLVAHEIKRWPCLFVSTEANNKKLSTFFFVYILIKFNLCFFFFFALDTNNKSGTLRVWKWNLFLQFRVLLDIKLTSCLIRDKTFSTLRIFLSLWNQIAAPKGKILFSVKFCEFRKVVYLILERVIAKLC